MTRLEVLPVAGLGEIASGDDLAALISSRFDLVDGDVVVVSSKIVSKALGLAVAASSREGAVAGESVRLVAARRTPRGLAQIVEAAAGPVMAAAGVDNSNVAPGTVLLLPSDPDACAQTLLSSLRALSGAQVGVIISDTAGRAWRDGQIDFALGAAGVTITDDLRGTMDTHGQPMEVTVRAVVDELAAAADLVKGKLSAVPVAIVRGLTCVTADDGPGAAALLRPAREDWFRLGHVEAVRASLGVDPGDVAPPAMPLSPVRERLSRVLEVALASGVPGWTAKHLPTAELVAGSGSGSGSGAGAGSEAEATARISVAHEDADPEPEDWLHLGAFAQAVAAAAWSEDLAVTQTVSPGPPPALLITAHPR